MRHRSTLLKLLVLLAVFGLIAAACGDSDGGDGESTATSEAGGEGEGEEDEGDGTATTLPVTSTSEGEAAGEPVHGGRLVYGIEADSANPWVHYATSCAISCRMIFRAVSDPLFVTTEAGDLVPYLVDTVESNADLTEWTMTIKDGIFFHDGEPLDGPAVAENIMACKLSSLTGPGLTFLKEAVGEGQTVTVTYIQPDALGPTALREEVCGYMFSPKWMRTLDSYPIEELKTGGGDPTAPVGVGTVRVRELHAGQRQQLHRHPQRRLLAGRRAQQRDRRGHALPRRGRVRRRRRHPGPVQRPAVRQLRHHPHRQRRRDQQVHRRRRLHAAPGQRLRRDQLRPAQRRRRREPDAGGGAGRAGPADGPGQPQRRLAAPQPPLPQGAGPRPRPGPVRGGARRRPHRAGERPVPARFGRLPGGHRLPAVRPGGRHRRRWTPASASSARTRSSSASTPPTTRSTSRP